VHFASIPKDPLKPAEFFETYFAKAIRKGPYIGKAVEDEP